MEKTDKIENTAEDQATEATNVRINKLNSVIRAQHDEAVAATRQAEPIMPLGDLLVRYMRISTLISSILIHYIPYMSYMSYRYTLYIHVIHNY